MCMPARMRRLVWSGDGTYVRPWPARGKICACAFLVAERISARQYIFSGYMYVCTYVRTFGHQRRRVRVGVACAGAGA